MTLEYSLSEADYVTYQLFTASRSKRVQRSKLIGQLILPLIIVPLCILFWRRGLYNYIIGYGITGLLWFALYGLYVRWRHRRHYVRFVRENFKGAIDRPVHCEFQENHVILKRDDNESKISFQEFVEINEIPKLILIKMKGGSSMLFPKPRIAEIETLRTQLQGLSSRLGIAYQRDDAWKW